MTIDHLCELLVGFQSLPLQVGLPVVEGVPRPAFPLVTPQLAEGFLRQVSSVQPLVGGQQGLQRLSATRGQILVAVQQDILLTLDEAARQSGVFAHPDLVQGVVQMVHHMQLLDENGGLRHSTDGDIVNRLPHVHHRQPNAVRILLALPAVALFLAGLRMNLAAEPDRPAPDQIVYHDVVCVPFADRDLVDADGLRSGNAEPYQLDPHILHVHFIEGMPVQVQFFGNILAGARSAVPADEAGEPLRLERIVGKEVEMLSIHFAEAPAQNPPSFEFQINPCVATAQIAHSPCCAIVSTRVRSTTLLEEGFFERRPSLKAHTFGSLKTPRTIYSVRKAAKEYKSRRRSHLRKVAIAKSCGFPKSGQTSEPPVRQGSQALSSRFLPALLRESPCLFCIDQFVR